VEFGTGFAAARMRGSEHNDPILTPDGTTATNHAGGVVGGITNGNPIVARVAVKPTASIATPQQTLNTETGKIEELIIKGRHDACIALRAPVVVEAALAIALCDLWLIARPNLR
ncbi:MAG: chorismate synthase, partial [Alistipes sp.]|nr:chorismate synthase [Alistipes sp.]